MSFLRNRRALFLLGLTATLLCHCGRDEAPPVGVLKTTTHEFTLHAGPEGPLYTVRDEKGKVLVREVSGAVLAAEFPLLNEDLKGLYAGNQLLAPSFPRSDSAASHIGNAAFENKPLDLSPLGPGAYDLPSLPDFRKP